MGTLYKRAKGSRNWMMAVTINGRQVCKSTPTSNKRLADQLLSRWETEVFEGRFHLPKSAPPPFEEWADEFLARVAHPNTRKRCGRGGIRRSRRPGRRSEDCGPFCPQPDRLPRSWRIKRETDVA